MTQKRKRSKVEQARQILKGRVNPIDEYEITATDDEAEDELWEWIYEDPEDTDSTNTQKQPTPGRSGLRDMRRIVGARAGSVEIRVGDTVVLAATGNETWAAIICEFSEGETEDEDGDRVLEKRAMFQWFSPEKEIRNKAKKRTDFLPNELYATTERDENPLTTINGKATVMSEALFNQMFTNGKVPRSSKDHGKVFVCRRGVNTRTASYTDEFIWEDIYHGQEEDIDSLVDLINSQTVRSRAAGTRGTRKPAPRRNVKDLDNFVVPSSDEEGPSTPRKKKQKLTASTPTSRHEHASPRKLTTPTHRRIIAKRPLEFTPLGTRILDPSHTASPHQLARSTLHVSAVPNALPGRESEFETVYTHLEAAISAGTGSCIYISGTPGTGKTATVREVVAALHSAVAEEALDDFVFVEINGMKVTDPHQSYSLLWEALHGDRVSASHALELLEREFSTPSPRRVPCVVLMDELDQLVTRNQAVMYNLFNWPNLRHSRLIVLAVANTMDLPERTLSNKISSRLGLTRITFSGYTHQQLIRIIESRLESVGGMGVVVDKDAVQFASRKVAAVSGDARRALDICRRAVEIAEAEVAGKDKEAQDTVPGIPSKKKGVVTIATIKQAINEATSTPLAAYLRSLPLASKLFLAALLARIRRTGIAEATLADCVDEARRMAVTTTSQAEILSGVLLAPNEPVDEGYGSGGSGERLPSTPAKRGRHKIERGADKAARVRGLGSAAMELAEAGIVGLETRRGERVGRVRLGVAEEDVRGALREDGECRGLGFVA